ncbi:hypothetical protein ANN_23305 [Periplaneta americana]|uniref:Uncharacterized protein n=1 Tax=Periplaneta americana TaxID=6978 RepID=A0ABQ8SM65_PERAM|nr:hypothetical protein ANN_23305 [Periplaneta americana]
MDGWGKLNQVSAQAEIERNSGLGGKRLSRLSYAGGYDVVTRRGNDTKCMEPVPTQHRDANQTIPPFWLDDRPLLLRHVDVRPAAGWSV